MIKNAIKALVFSAISLCVTQAYINGIDFGDDRTAGMFLLVLGLAAINFFAVPALGIVGFKAKGFSAIVIRFALTGAMFYFLSPAIPGLKFVDTTLPELIIRDFVLPSKDLNSLMSLIFSALMFGALYSFLNWLSSKR